MPVPTPLNHTLLVLAFALAAPLAGSGAAADETTPAAASPVAASIAHLLNVDASPGKAQVEEAERRYRDAISLAPGDARVEYAYSLILQKQFKATEARSHLQRSLQLNSHYPPALKTLIREAIKAQKFQDARERIAAFATYLVEHEPSNVEQSEWLGRIVGTVIHALGTDDAKVIFAYQDRLFRVSFPPLMRSAYERGFNSIEAELSELTESIEEAKSGAAVQRQAKKAEVDAQLVDQQNEIKRKQQDATKTRQKWDEWITDQTAKADDLLREQEKRFQDLDRAVTNQVGVVAALRLQLDRVERNMTPITSTSLVTGFRSTPRERVELALFAEEQKLGVIYSQQEAVSRQAAEILNGRRNAVAEYQRATGVALKEAANLDRWEKRTKAVSENMKKAAEKKPAQVAALETRIKSLNTWDPSDFETEKRRLLADLGVVNTDK
ncbi:hypothetical protein Pan44_49270 [Caulifigura coniformis]|uniref:Uncharacterized protein n=1 Tax=Caulifigura coniformis TaxID=2527983 RepID=A0A517SL77_9PLAN|nr:hypothetical protein [Caulifigura coniformis]QDT56866.1 hypothetical protein Pan44_49270 [Caulifigura coniformis]